MSLLIYICKKDGIPIRPLITDVSHIATDPDAIQGGKTNNREKLYQGIEKLLTKAYNKLFYLPKNIIIGDSGDVFKVLDSADTYKNNESDYIEDGMYDYIINDITNSSVNYKAEAGERELTSFLFSNLTLESEGKKIEMSGNTDIKGMRANKIMTEYYYYFYSQSNIELYKNFFEERGFEIKGILPENIAGAISACTDIEMQNGVLMVHIGHSKTELVVIRNRRIAHSQTLASFGGATIKQSLMQELKMSKESADQYIDQCADLQISHYQEQDQIDMVKPNVEHFEYMTTEGQRAKEDHIVINGYIIRAIYSSEEFIEKVKVSGSSVNNIVFTGGISNIKNAKVLFSAIFDPNPVRIGYPTLSAFDVNQQYTIDTKDTTLTPLLGLVYLSTYPNSYVINCFSKQGEVARAGLPKETKQHHYKKEEDTDTPRGSTEPKEKKELITAKPSTPKKGMFSTMKERYQKFSDMFFGPEIDEEV